MWWLGLVSQMMEVIQQCPECIKKVRQPKEPPSRYPTFNLPVANSEVIKLTSTTSSAVIRALRSVFSRHGIPDIVRSDNGPRYPSEEFAQFAHAYGF